MNSRFQFFFSKDLILEWRRDRGWIPSHAELEKIIINFFKTRFRSFRKMFEVNGPALLVCGLLGLVVYSFTSRTLRHRRRRAYFKGKVALVTGSSLGLGRAIAQELHVLGCQVVLCARNQVELERAKRQLLDLVRLFAISDDELTCSYVNVCEC